MTLYAILHRDPGGGVLVIEQRQLREHLGATVDRDYLVAFSAEDKATAYIGSFPALAGNRIIPTTMDRLVVACLHRDHELVIDPIPGAYCGLCGSPATGYLDGTPLCGGHRRILDEITRRLDGGGNGNGGEPC